MANYAHPEALVSTKWVAERLTDNDVVIVEVDVNTEMYDEGHIPGARGWNWKTQLCDTHQRDIISQSDFNKLMGMSGIRKGDTVVLYGDNNNWFAAWAFWQMKVYGHKDVRIMDGGRKKWVEEERILSTDMPNRPAREYHSESANTALRAMLSEVMAEYQRDDTELVDVRSPDEFTGKILAPPGLPETCQRGGHIPGANNITWARACKEDGTFKSVDELRELYAQFGVTADKNVITYCRIGERSSHSWFVLKYLLGFKNVKNYDGSWTEWGNLVGVPIERGE